MRPIMRLLALVFACVLGVGILLSGLAAVYAAPLAQPTATLAPREAIRATATAFAAENVLPTAMPPVPLKAIYGRPGVYRPAVRGNTYLLNARIERVRTWYRVAPGQALTFDLTSDTVDTYLRIEDFDGNVLAEDDNSGEGSNSRIVGFVAPEGVTEYYVVATSAAYALDGVVGAEGNIRLTVTDHEAVERDALALRNAPPLYQDEVLPRTDQTRVGVWVGRTGALVRVPVQVRAGDALTFELSQDASAVAEPADPYLYLLDASDNVVAQDDDSAGLGNARIPGYVATADGTLTALVTTYQAAQPNNLGWIGDSLLTLTVTNHTLRGDSPPAPLEDVLREATLPGVVSADVPPRRHLDVVFEARAGQVARLSVKVDAPHTLSRPMAHLYNADGNPVFDGALLDVFNTLVPMFLEQTLPTLPPNAFVIPADGRYTLRVENDISYDSLGITVTLADFDPVPLAAEGIMTVPLTTADAGRQLMFRVPGDSRHRRNLLVAAPQGSLLVLSNRIGAQESSAITVQDQSARQIHWTDVIGEDTLLLVSLPDPLPDPAPLTITLTRRQLPWLNEGVTAAPVRTSTSIWMAFLLLGVQGETVHLDLVAPPEHALRLELTDTNDRWLAGTAYDGQARIQLSFTPPATGLYHVMVAMDDYPRDAPATTVLTTIHLERESTGAP